MNEVRDVTTAGIHCDYCHKVGGVYLDPASGSVYPNTPGTESQRVLRPPPGDNIFFGPYDDIKDPDTYLPLITQSQYCAPCHQFSFWGTPIYESYVEWLASPYADAGVACQDCHMPPNGDTHFALPEFGGLEHPPERIPSHLQIGASDIELLQNTVAVTLTARQELNELEVTVAISNIGAGHHVPTDFPGRHMILTVSVMDEEQRTFAQLSGPAVPAWGGQQAGLPGLAFAKVLRDVETGEAPVASYWRQTAIVSDNRIPARGTNTSTYQFTIPSNEDYVMIAARLLFRRVFSELDNRKEWGVADIMMAEDVKEIALQPTSNTFIPFLTTVP
jgi:hypothetical protein